MRKGKSSNKVGQVCHLDKPPPLSPHHPHSPYFRPLLVGGLSFSSSLFLKILKSLLFFDAANPGARAGHTSAPAERTSFGKGVFLVFSPNYLKFFQVMIFRLQIWKGNRPGNSRWTCWLCAWDWRPGLPSSLTKLYLYLYLFQYLYLYLYTYMYICIYMCMYILCISVSIFVSIFADWLNAR